MQSIAVPDTVPCTLIVANRLPAGSMLQEAPLLVLMLLGRQDSSHGVRQPVPRRHSSRSS